MSKIKSIIAIVILIISWCLMFWITGNRTPWQAFSSTDKGDGVSVFLGDIPSENYDRMGFTKGLIEYIVSKNAWLVGTDRGELFLFDNSGKQIWKRSLGIGKLVSLCVSHDEKITFVGEQSPAGNLYAIDLDGGDILWKFAAEKVVGVEPDKRSYPSIVHICIDKDDNVYANAYRFVTAKDGGRGYNGKAVAFNKNGEQLWQFPKSENIDSWINWCDVNDNNDKVVLSTSAYEIRPDMKYRDTMYLIDKKTNSQIPINKKDFKIGREEKYVDYVTSEPTVGRLHASIVLDEQGKIVFVRDANSKNGTFVNGEKIQSNINVQIKDGDVIRFGRDEYILQLR